MQCGWVRGEGLGIPSPLLGCHGWLRFRIGGVAELVVVMAVVWLLLLCWYDACAVFLSVAGRSIDNVVYIFVAQVVQVSQAAHTVAPCCTDTAMWARTALVSP